MIREATASLLRYRLDQPVGGSGVASGDVMVVELREAGGATGLGFTYVLGGGAAAVLAAPRGTNSIATSATSRSFPIGSGS